MIFEARPTPAQLIAFYLEAGVDCALNDAPGNWLTDPDIAEPAAPPTVRAAATIPPPTRPAAVDPVQAVARARRIADDAPTLEALRAAMDVFDGCALRLTATQLVFGEGQITARVMFVGDMPQREEDLEGRPFVGPAGRLLDRILTAAGLERGAAYLTNVIPWRPPGNRAPTPHEIEVCLPFVRSQIALVDPDVLIVLGDLATRALLQVREGIAKSRGRWIDYDTGARTIRAMPMFHPDYLLDVPIAKRQAWQDIRAVAAALR